VVCAAGTLVGRELAVGIYLVFEAAEERLAGWASAGAAVGRACQEISAAIRALMFLATRRHLRPTALG
jgi:hypothetical protein